MITIHIKTPKEKKSIEVDGNADIKTVKEAISEKFGNAPLESLCLIFAGKIIKDHDTLQTHNIKDGMTVHLVIKQSANAARNNDSSSTASTTDTTSSQNTNNTTTTSTPSNPANIA